MRTLEDKKRYIKNEQTNPNAGSTQTGDNCSGNNSCLGDIRSGSTRAEGNPPSNIPICDNRPSENNASVNPRKNDATAANNYDGFINMENNGGYVRRYRRRIP